MNCRHCGAPLHHTFLDLGFAPPSNAYLAARDLHAPETWLPLKLHVCTHCWLVQTEDYARADELFRHDYAYFSSTSSTWLEHARRYSEMIRHRLSLDHDSMVVEIASNDGYLLRNFLAARIPCLGIEPTDGTAAAAAALGIPVLREFFGERLARRLAAAGQQADLLIGNNVYAHVPDIDDVTAGLKILLKPGGTVTLEFPHLLQLLGQTQFDTIYHEHYSYLSLFTVTRLFGHAGLRVLDVEELPTHGGSLRIYGCHIDDPRPESNAVATLIERERQAGLRSLSTYAQFQSRVERIKDDLLTFLIAQKRAGRKVAAYGAAAKGNTLLNFAGIRPDLIRFVCDAAPAKQGKFLPGSHIPILAPEVLKDERPDLLLVLPWNILDEVMRQNAFIAEWGGRFVVPLPELKVIPEFPA
jgi:hypothetical protein